MTGLIVLKITAEGTMNLDHTDQQRQAELRATEPDRAAEHPDQRPAGEPTGDRQTSVQAILAATKAS